ncbi:hypothetical protein Poli38472_011525 [Pythium oligandrum]|uniref:EF-hand domain-containing protein n=1 Tax=Pythium oligandrum TaxID=41045 RepID=A0A8K1CJY9_PYTOL|nr:hypothetical protein Poli38472_011525 [Pythium oligandrum]|eukprot:TMW64645.1 hypothetical protein Poli38472_011525 [Pythium oligandrum]
MVRRSSLDRFRGGWRSTLDVNTVAPVTDVGPRRQSLPSNVAEEVNEDRRPSSPSIETIRSVTRPASPKAIPPVLGARRASSSWRQHIAAIFPTSYDTQVVPFVGVASEREDGVVHVLQTLFATCDGNDDGFLTEKELVMFLELCGFIEEETGEMAKEMVSSRDRVMTAPTQVLSFPLLLTKWRSPILARSAEKPLPRTDFLLRCKRLKHGFKKCDGDGNQYVKRFEFEIALQKLDFVLPDWQLGRIFHVLDRDGSGHVDWSDLIYAAWHNTLAQVTESMLDHFTIDHLAELPALIRPATMSAIAIAPNMNVRSAPVSPAKGTPTYYGYFVPVNIVVSLLEVNGMYAMAVVSAFRLTVCTNLRLFPRDDEREFLMRAITRAALQAGHRKDKLFGMDPMKGSPRMVLLMTFLMFKSKRYVLKSLIKLFIKRVIWRAAAKSVLSLLVLPINGVLNAWTLRNVMLNCRVSIIGPPCVTALLELFFLQDESLVPFQRVDYIRVLGCSLVCKRYVHPNVEIMIDHMRHRWVNPSMWPTSDKCTCLGSTEESCPVHQLDDIDRFLTSLQLYAAHRRQSPESLARQHIQNMFFLLIVAFVIDGNVDWVERGICSRACYAAHLQNRWKGVLAIKDDFIAGKGIHMDKVMALIEGVPISDTQDDESAVQRARAVDGVTWIRRESTRPVFHILRG